MVLHVHLQPYDFSLELNGLLLAYLEGSSWIIMLSSALIGCFNVRLISLAHRKKTQSFIHNTSTSDCSAGGWHRTWTGIRYANVGGVTVSDPIVMSQSVLCFDSPIFQWSFLITRYTSVWGSRCVIPIYWTLIIQLYQGKHSFPFYSTVKRLYCIPASQSESSIQTDHGIYIFYFGWSIHLTLHLKVWMKDTYLFTLVTRLFIHYCKLHKKLTTCSTENIMIQEDNSHIA